MAIGGSRRDCGILAWRRALSFLVARSSQRRREYNELGLTSRGPEGDAMDLTVIPTFRCNSRCQMCYIWKNPTEPKLEVTAQTLSKLPGGFDNLNLSGGEPTLRRDLP